MNLLNFISKKVLDFQKKRLVSAEETLRKYIHDVEKLEKEDNPKELENCKKMVKIWTDNIKKIKKEIKKIESR